MGRLSSRTSLQDVASQAGVHVSTVSLALRGDRRIPVATRKRIRKIADRLGYKANPLVSALMAQVRQPERAASGAGMALITAFRAEENPRRSSFYRQFGEGAHAEAAHLGYSLSEWNLKQGTESPAGILRAMKYRGIRGVLLFDPGELISETTARLFTKELSVVVILRCGGGYSFHRVTTDVFGNMMLAIATLRSRGFRRIGCILGGAAAGFITGAHSAMLYAQSQWPAGERIPPLVRDPYPTAREALRWHRRHRPDAIVSSVEFIRNVLVEAGVEVPGDTYFCMIGAEANAGCPGVDSRGFEVGKAAVFKLAGLLHNNRYGLPDIPLVSAIPGVWKDGSGSELGHS